MDTDLDWLDEVEALVSAPGLPSATLGRLQVRLLARAVRALEAIAINTTKSRRGRPPGSKNKPKPAPQD